METPGLSHKFAMKNYLSLLCSTSLFNGLTAEELQTLLSQLGAVVRSYGKGEALVLAGEPSRRVDLLVLKSLRAKVCAYLLSESERAGSLTFSIPFSRIQLADYLNCDRSALSRELSQMQRDGLLDTYKSSFKLLEPEVLKQMVQ